MYIKFQKCPLMKFHKNTAAANYLHITYGCFHAKSELSSCDRLQGQCNLKYLLSGPLQKRFADPWPAG